MNVLIAGGSGAIGKAISRLLSENGHEVAWLTRKLNPEFNYKQINWNPLGNKILAKDIEGYDAIINLAGTNLSEKKWSPSRKLLIRNSRIKSNLVLANAIAELKNKPEVFLASSAIGYYGSITRRKIFREEDPSGEDFLGTTCKLWEKSAEQVSNLNIRTIKIRTGVVLDSHSGALKQMIQFAKKNILSPLGTGKQYVPWIHIKDIARMYVHCLENKQIEGVFNGVSPEEINNKLLTYKLLRHLNKRQILPKVPGFMLRLIYGKMSTIVLDGSRVSPEKIISTNFNYEFPKLDDALRDLVKKPLIKT